MSKNILPIALVVMIILNLFLIAEREIALGVYTFIALAPLIIMGITYAAEVYMESRREKKEEEKPWLDPDHSSR